MSKLNPNALKLSEAWPASTPSAGRLVGAAKDVARRLRRSPRFWVLASTLLPALVCTLLAWAYASSLWQLVLYFWYSIPSNSFVYLPNEPGVLFAAAVYSPWVVAVVGGVATMIACIIDYAVIKRVFEFQQVARVKQTGIYKKAIQCFYWRPWPTIAVLAVTPLALLSDPGPGAQLRLSPLAVYLGQRHRTFVPLLSPGHRRFVDARPAPVPDTNGRMHAVHAAAGGRLGALETAARGGATSGDSRRRPGRGGSRRLEPVGDPYRFRPETPGRRPRPAAGHPTSKR